MFSSRSNQPQSTSFIMRFTVAAVVLGTLLCAALGAQQAQEPPKYNPPLFKGDKKNSKEENSKARSVQGFVRTPQDDVVDGAIVQLKDMKTLQVRSFITKEDGQYHFSGLNPNVDYQLKADRPGASSSVKTITVYEGRKELTINLKLEPKSDAKK